MTKTLTKTKKPRKSKTPRRTTTSENGQIKITTKPDVASMVAARLNKGETVYAQKIADELGVSYPAVWQVLRRWAKEGKVVRELVDNMKDGGPITFAYSLKK